MSRAGTVGAGGVRADVLDRDALARACKGVGTVFHCAGYAHADDDGSLHREINLVGTRNVAEIAGEAGAGCFVFMSSVKAMGLPGDDCIDETWPLAPETAYGMAKREAEAAVLAAGARFGMRVTNLRLAMVYGRGGRGNLDRMARAIRQGWFPPLPETGAKRSLVHVDDVVDAALTVAGAPRAAGKTYIVASDRPCSGREIYDELRRALGLPAPPWRCPVSLLRLAGATGDALARLTGRRFPLDRQAVGRLIGAECYSPALIREELGWRAGVSLAEGLRETFPDGRGALR